MPAGPGPTRRLLLGTALATVPAALPLAPALAAGEATGTLGRILRAGLVRVGVWLDAPPWGSYGENGSPDGSEVAIARLLARDLGVRLRLERLTVRERLEALETDRVDLLAALVPIQASTRARFAFATPHTALYVTVAAPRASTIRRIEDLAARRIALPEGTFAAEEMRGRLPPDTTALFLRDISLTRPEFDIEARIEVTHSHSGLAIRLGDADLLRFLNTFLYLRTADGTIPDIQERYFRAPQPPTPTFR
jgi:polar amino acid transport system substrate-binding protein